MAYEFVKVERDGPITVVTINRPEVMNVFDAFDADPEQWVAIITGAGERAFSAGNDLRYTAENRGQLKIVEKGFGGLTSRFDMVKPVIAAVNGVAMGGGFEIALACDIIVASENAIFALPEPRVGLAALAGGLHRLPRQIGEKAAMGMILTGRRVPAKEGEALGFVNEVVPAGEALAGAKRWAAQIIECGPMSIRASKDAVQRSLAEPSVEAGLKAQNKYPAVAALFASEDLVEGPRAFAEKRAPVWVGK
jgi:crotonobetainyl-CoA hydratase